ncbi:hypothetical protein K2173_002870 [Erythroxylum novogranatense]|uniref:Uncharacterized protein n=1 Tax=Erythroxylum novogranatense TaxID=1862640 RepID=A0AAV8SR21_9ROSI|nr:hypothetical protein K2173_002870 [Erythroxylum novogranatense]
MGELLLHFSSKTNHKPTLLSFGFASFCVNWSLSNSLFNASSSSLPHPPNFPSSSFSPCLVHVRHVSSRERRKNGKPMTPATSKVKKIKIKSYSSYKLRFRTLNDGSIRCWREGKNHNAHEKVLLSLAEKVGF